LRPLCRRHHTDLRQGLDSRHARLLRAETGNLLRQSDDRAGDVLQTGNDVLQEDGQVLPLSRRADREPGHLHLRLSRQSGRMRLDLLSRWHGVLPGSRDDAGLVL
jgi:hypothetical protein